MSARNLRAAIPFLFFVLVQFTARAQFYSLPTDCGFHFANERLLAKRDSVVNPVMQPFIPFFSGNYAFVMDSHRVFRYIRDDKALDLIFHNHFIQVQPRGESFTLTIDPVLNLEAGTDAADTSHRRLLTNSRGVVAAGGIGERFYFETMLVENQTLLPRYLEDFADSTATIPGQGRWKTFKTRGYDYAFSTGIISIQLLKNLNLQLGHGKHKVGFGYRSLLLSDNAFNYPFVRITQQWLRGKVRYTNIYATMMDLVPASAVVTPNTERLFRKKLAVYQTLAIQPHPIVTLSFFQGVLTAGGDLRNRQHPDVLFFSPVIYSQLAAFGMSDPTHQVISGADLLVKVTRKINVYGQLLAAPNAASGGYQAGLKYFDSFGLRGLTLAGEYNRTAPDAYRRNGTYWYQHYGASLGQVPACGSEAIGIADYRRKRFYLSARVHVQSDVRDGGGRRQITSIQGGYVINPRYNLNLCAGYTGRRNFPTFGGNDPGTDYLFVSLRTSIFNRYYDF